MNLFQSSDKLYKLVDENYNLLPIMNRFGIRPGFKDKTVAEVCREKQIDKNFFLALVNTYNNPGYFPETELLGFSPLLIVDYLKKTHTYYLDYFLPKLEILLEVLIDGSSENKKDLKMIRTFYEKYKKEFLNHIRDEEENIFPYIVGLVEKEKMNSHSIPPVSFEFEQEHSNMEVKLNDLKNLLIRYLAPVYDDNDFNEFMASLYRFEQDMADHSRIEDKILVTQMQKIV